MTLPGLYSASLRLCGILLLLSAASFAQSIPAPKDVIGFTPGDDRKLASWAQIVEYFKKLDTASDRVKFEEIGKTTLGAPFVYATISSPENLRNLEKYKKINAQLADPRTFNSRDKFAERLIAEGKTIVMITCGIHSTEVGSTLSSMLIAHRLASSNEPDVKKVLDNTIILLVPSLNPDGVDIVKNWYDKTLGTKFEGTEPPELYHKYVGHDNNRDWYAFTQVETQLTVDKIHNVWHPQIVHDIHQQGQNGSRLFLPPYMQPVEPNVPKQIVEGYTELGNAMAADLRKKGLEGITTNSTYDAWTPARAYSHYHGGVRILSETASCKLATPITVKFDELRPGEGYDAKKESANFGPVWKGGEWHLRNITDTMTATADSLLNIVANDREKWLTRFYQIGKEAVRPRKNGEVSAYIIPTTDDSKLEARRLNLFRLLKRGGVTVEWAANLTVNGERQPAGTAVVKTAQPYGLFAKTLLERQAYPDLKDASGNPISPYDVTAHSLNLLLNLEIFRANGPLSYRRMPNPVRDTAERCGKFTGKALIYHSTVPSMDEGWTRWVVERNRNEQDCLIFDIIGNQDFPVLYSEFLSLGWRRIIFPDQSPNQILNGYAKGTMPDEYTGGVGKEGVENLKKFVEAGGTLVFLNRSSDFAIEQFNLPVRDVTKGLARKDFYIPGSILRTELDTTSPIAKGMPAESIAWFENGPVFEITGGDATVRERVSDDGTLPDGRVSARVIGRYPDDPAKILLSGWALGAEKIAGRAALVEVRMGKGKIILFGFRPQYRGQSLATFPLLFNAISQ